jgi:hypothetical protein
MKKELFLEIESALMAHDSYFRQTANAANKLGASCRLKCSIALKMLAYGIPGDLVDEMYEMSESSNWNTVRRFCKSICEIYADQIRPPTDDELLSYVNHNTTRGFPGMFASWDCTHLSKRSITIGLTI